jgi:hypothetical protein
VSKVGGILKPFKSFSHSTAPPLFQFIDMIFFSIMRATLAKKAHFHRIVYCLSKDFGGSDV